MISVKNIKKLILLLLISVITISCGGVDSDAKKAAELTNKSCKLATQMKLDESEKAYLQSKEIRDKYIDHKHEDKFLKSYIKHRDNKKKK